ncbi:MAG TPA: right-handed parallel beta-helix repeat-containing protein, partial [bacterium]|nr:right-handed parallel beta-helix repeat-containing protein [bacterium]
SSGEIRASSIEGASRRKTTGIAVLDDCEVLIQNNKIATSFIGILCDEGSVCSVVDNGISSGEGIALDGTSEGDIRGNTISGRFVGIGIKGHSRGSVAGNRITGISQGIGLSVREMGEGEILRNKVSEFQTAVLLDDDALAVLRENEFRTCLTGIRSHPDTQLIMEKNIFQCDTEQVVDRPLPEESGTGVPETGRQKLQNFVLSSQDYPLFRQIYGALYNIGRNVSGFSFWKTRGLRSIYLRRGMAGREWRPGASDIDYFFVLDDMDPEREAVLVDEIGKEYGKLKRIVPFLGEIQLSSPQELENYLRHGDIRAWEAPSNWKQLYGEAMPSVEYEFEKKKFQFDLITDMLNSWRLINDAFFYPHLYRDRDYRILKGLIDILKQRAYLKGRKKIFRNRREVLAYAEKHSEEEWLGGISRFWQRKERMEEETCSRFFLAALNLLDDCAGEIRREMEDSRPDRSGSRFRIKPLEKRFLKSAGTSGDWAEFSAGVKNLCGERIRSLVLDSPGLLYVILKREALEEAFLGSFREIAAGWRREAYLKETPLFLLTENIFWGASLSLHLENPFNWMKRIPEEGDLQIVCGGEKSCQSNLDIRFFPPDEETLFHLIREGVTLLTVSSRMAGAMHAPDNRKFLYQTTLNKVLGLSLALGKKVIVPPFTEILLKEYARCRAPGHERLNRLTKIISDPADFSAAAAGKEFLDILIERVRELNRLL